MISGEKAQGSLGLSGAAKSALNSCEANISLQGLLEKKNR